MKEIMNLTQFQQSVMKDKGTHIVKFYGDWCSPCKMFDPIVEDIEKEYSDKITFHKVNVDVASDVASENGVMSVPTMLIISNGCFMKSIVGYRNKQQLLDELKACM